MLFLRRCQGFRGKEGDIVELLCSSNFISVKSATWKSSTDACPSARDCTDQIRRLCKFYSKRARANSLSELCLRTSFLCHTELPVTLAVHFFALTGCESRSQRIHAVAS